MRFPKNGRARRAAVRTFAAGAAILVVTGSFASPGRAAPAPRASVMLPRASTSDNATSATLSGEGASDPSAELTTWQNDLYGNSGTLNLNYVATGGYKARQDLLSGSIDYAISGVPFTPAELATLPKGSGVIGAPVMASALGVLATPPADNADYGNGGHGWGLLSTDPNTGDSTFAPYTGPLKVPTLNLAAMLMQDNIDTSGGVPLNEWNNPSIISAFGLQQQTSNGTTPDIQYQPAYRESSRSVLRSDPSETDYYSLLFAQSAAPEVWTDLQKYDQGTFQVADVLPATLNQPDTRQGLANQVTHMFPSPNTTTGVLTLPPVGDGSDGAGGEVAPVQPSALDLTKSSSPAEAAYLQWISVQNANGDWVTPSPASIDAAVDAGGETPFYGLSHSVPNAYPLTYVDYLYAPSSGLSVDKTEALATAIRYMATDGQGAMAANNDGSLSPGLVSQALAAANQIVLSNCTGSGAQLVVSADPGRFAPNLPGMKSIGSMLHCDPVSTTGSATTATTPSNSPASGGLDLATGGGYVPTTSAALPSTGSGAAASAIAPATAAPLTAGSKPAGGGKPPAARPPSALSLADLPISLPFSNNAGFDRFTALLLGAAFFFLGKRVVSWLVRLARQ